MVGSLYPALTPERRLDLARSGWTFHDYLEGEEVVASAMMHGPEIHIIVAPQWRGRAMSRRRVRAFLAPLLEQYGYLATRVLHNREEQRRFVERVGFTQTWSDSMFCYYMLTTLPFERRAK